MIILFFIIITLTNLISEEEKKTWTHTAVTGLSVNIQKGVESNVVYFDAMYRFKLRRYGYVLSGLQVTSANIGFVLNVNYTPLSTKNHQIGVGVLYHLEHVYKIETEHNIITAVDYTFKLPDNFLFYTQLGYFYKTQHIPISGYPSVITKNHAIAFQLYSEKIFAKEWHIGLGFGSYELFRYPLFAAPSFVFRFYYHSNGKVLPKGMFAGMNAVLRYSDFFTITGTIDNFVMRFVWGWEF